MESAEPTRAGWRGAPPAAWPRASGRSRRQRCGRCICGRPMRVRPRPGGARVPGGGGLTHARAQAKQQPQHQDGRPVRPGPPRPPAPELLRDPWSRADLAHLLALPGGFGLLARLFERNLAGLDGMRGVGFALCRVVRDEGELLSIGVGPVYRRRAIGSALLRESMERCRRAGAVDHVPRGRDRQRSAQKLYQAFGFDEVGGREGYYQRPNGTRISAYTMRCDLAARWPPLTRGAAPTGALSCAQAGGSAARRPLAAPPVDRSSPPGVSGPKFKHTMALVSQGTRQHCRAARRCAQANAGHLARRHVVQQQLGLHEGQRTDLGRDIQAVLRLCSRFLTSSTDDSEKCLHQ